MFRSLVTAMYSHRVGRFEEMMKFRCVRKDCVSFLPVAQLVLVSWTRLTSQARSSACVSHHCVFHTAVLLHYCTVLCCAVLRFTDVAVRLCTTRCVISWERTGAVRRVPECPIQLVGIIQQVQLLRAKNFDLRQFKTNSIDDENIYRRIQ